MPEITQIEISTEEYQQPFTNLFEATDYFLEQLKLYRPVFGYLIQIGKEENYKVLINERLPHDEGSAKISVIMKFQIQDTTLRAFKITIDD